MGCEEGARRLAAPGWIDFSVGLYNLLNQHYADPGGSEHRQDSIPQDRFSFRVQLSYRF